MPMSAPVSTPPLHICALGSSFAAGPGIPPILSKEAGRSANNYPHILTALLNTNGHPAKLTDLTVSGATLLNLSSEPQTTSPASLFRKAVVFPPQIEGLPEDADIVTVTGGGNDLLYVGGLMIDSIHAYYLGRKLFHQTAATDLGQGAEDIRDKFLAVIDAIQARAPKARIFLVEYLCLLGGDVRPGVDVSFGEERIEFHRGVERVLNEGYRLAAEARKGVSVVGIHGVSEGHGVGSLEPWVEGFSLWGIWEGRAPWHPNAEGMKAVGEAVHGELKRSGVLDGLGDAS